MNLPVITAADTRPAAVMRVDAVYHRNDPILFGSPPLKPPRFHFGLPFRAASIWSNLETCGVTDVVGAWQHVSQLMTVISLKQRYAGHSKRAALIAAANSYMGRIVVVVDEDVDPSNLADVMWAVTTRCEPSGRLISFATRGAPRWIPGFLAQIVKAAQRLIRR